MPKGAGPITDYARYYTAEMHGERPVVVGVMLDRSIARVEPGVYIVPRKRLPLVADGGCGVVTIWYDAERDMILYVECNGVA